MRADTTRRGAQTDTAPQGDIMVERRRLLRRVGLTVAAAIAAGGLSGTFSWPAQAQHDEDPGTGQLAGQVLGADGAPLAGAFVTVISPELDAGDTSLTTDEAGRFTLGPIRSGLYDVAVEVEGYRRGLLATLKVENGQITQAEIVLERRTGGEDGY
jgi:hypothetical protein